jgi:crotonobetainyl-CoA:carnitine CoA-transferase CaiB-like acyl-CoA transferase
MSGSNRLFAEFCRAAGVDVGEGMRTVRVPPGVTLPSALATTELACGSVAAANLAAMQLAAARAGTPVGETVVDPVRVAAAFTSDRLLRVDGQPIQGFAELSGFFRTRDGWIRTHANYPHHRERLLRALGLPGDADVQALRARLETLAARDAERAITSIDGIAAAVRTEDEWARHEQGQAVAALRLLDVRSIGGGAVRRLEPSPIGLPLRGLRVLDLTRVIAGPVATRTLALLGADVLRIDSPRLPEIASQYADVSAGKRSTLLDLASADGREAFERLLARADVVVSGYRPGSLAAHGLSAAELARRRPGIVVATLSAWGAGGPWGHRRGFDSIVQAATGIAMREAGGSPAPGVLPAQALDHSTGYLVAAGIMHAIAAQGRDGGSWVVSAHLARTAKWLLDNDPADHARLDGDLAPHTTERDTPVGHLRYVLPAIAIPEGPKDFSRVGGVFGADPARWADDV